MFLCNVILYIMVIFIYYIVFNLLYFGVRKVWLYVLMGNFIESDYK